MLESCSNQKEKELLLRFYILCIEAELTKIQGEIKDEIHHYLRMSERALEEDTIWRGIRLLEGTTQMNMAKLLDIDRKRYVKLENRPPVWMHIFSTSYFKNSAFSVPIV